MEDGDDRGAALPVEAAWLAVLAADFLALSLCFRFGSRSTVAAAERSAHAVRVRLTDRMLAPDGTAVRDRMPGDLVSVAVSDAQNVGRFTTSVVQAIACVFALVLGAVLLLRMSVTLGLLVLLGTPAVLFAVHLLGRPLERRGAAEQAAAGGPYAELWSAWSSRATAPATPPVS
ncbi:hypothetical protein [Streptomyces sp. NPDC008139]|uniref:hypothetical protein n=1 Tax=Streptomyces sp. NPDC008139 TaxID=3364814 RepID=UPI0036E733BE